jgi:hypothetical protein
VVGRVSNRGVLALATILFVARPDHTEVRTHPLLVDDSNTLAELEDRGLSFASVVGADRLRDIVHAVERDIADTTAGQPPDSPRRPFRPEWLARGRFELVGIVNRIDRRRFDPSTCGEVRLVYRLAIQNRRRPATRLPMTVNVRIPQPRPPGDVDCARVAARWLAREGILSLVGSLPPPAQIEINYQSVHVPGARSDMDDNAEYVLRSFEVVGSSLRVDGLFNTPRPDLDPATLLAWVATHLPEIDDGSAVLPKDFLAERAVSVSPRGLTNVANRPFAKLLAPDAIARLPLHSLALARSAELLLRRLDESTCTGCHQTRAIAGFHLLGEERSLASFNTLAVGHSAHLTADLRWRETDLESAARGERAAPRPFALHPDGKRGSTCGLVPGLAAWSCGVGLACRDIHHADVGVCTVAASHAPGDPCEDVTVAPNARLEGPIVTTATTDSTCPAPVGEQREGPFCAPNWLGFTGGMCSERCQAVGQRNAEGTAICASLPAAGYEADCFVTDEPIERCLKRHFVTAFVATCDREHSCRDDYACARVPGAPREVGACVPPYFVFQARVDGPRLDR